MRRFTFGLVASALLVACGRVSQPQVTLPTVVYNYGLKPAQVTPTPAPLPPVQLPSFPWQEYEGDVQDLAEQFRPIIVMPAEDVENEPVSMLYQPFSNGRLFGIRYFVLYQDEDLQKSWEDKVYDAYRELKFGDEIDIEPIEVYITADTKELAGVAFKTGDEQPFYKRLVREKKWLQVPASELSDGDRDGDRPRIGVSTWNHLHDLPSVLAGRDFEPMVDVDVADLDRLTDDAKNAWKFASRGLLALPHGSRI